MPALRDDGDITQIVQDALGAPPQRSPQVAALPAISAAPSASPSPPVVSSQPRPQQGIATDQSGNLPVSVPVQSIVVLTADPVAPSIGQMWYRQDTSQLSIRHDAGTTKRVTLA